MIKRDYLRFITLVFSIFSFVLSIGTKLIYEKYHWYFLKVVCVASLANASVILLVMLFQYMVVNGANKGFAYFIKYVKIRNTLEKQMIDAGLFIERGKFIELPKFSIKFDEDLLHGKLSIRNSLKFDKKLDNVVMSSALCEYSVERHYQSDDCNYYIYELVDSSVNYRLEFSSFEEFLNYSKKISDYELWGDSRSKFKLQHMLLAGVTGGGKTYMLYNLLLQGLNKSIPYYYFFADPKGSSLAVVGHIISPNSTAVEMKDIICLLEKFVKKMRERKAEMESLLRTKLDADYASFNMSPYFFVFDEYASFSSILANEEKKTRDKVNALLSEIILQGRQLGFFAYITAQQASATILPTSLRDNLPLKIILGQSDEQTYVTALGAGTSIPNRHYGVGEGVFVEPRIAAEPKLIQGPFLNFDILEALKKSQPG